MSTLPAALADTIRAHATLVRSRRGNDVVSHGDTSNQVYLLLEGQVQIRLLTREGTEAILRDLKPGDFFGELAAIDEGPRSAWVVAVADSVLARIPGETFRAAVIGIPAVADWMARRLTAQIRDLTHRWFELNALQVRSRLGFWRRFLTYDVHSEIHVYPGCDHAFARPGGGHYDHDAATLANSRTDEFFARTLR